jgi:hypothetical protein
MAQGNYYVVIDGNVYGGLDGAQVEFWSEKGMDFADQTGETAQDAHVESSISVRTLLDFWFKNNKGLDRNPDFNDDACDCCDPAEDEEEE